MMIQKQEMQAALEKQKQDFQFELQKARDDAESMAIIWGAD
ncbi:MAG: hypothetical protein ABSC06_26385 [Rhodopila sp.]|jgi:hypothetical protein